MTQVLGVQAACRFKGSRSNFVTSMMGKRDSRRTSEHDHSSSRTIRRISHHACVVSRFPICRFPIIDVILLPHLSYFPVKYVERGGIKSIEK
jgi:hypothetical protein